MSKNFELLTHVERDRALSRSTERKAQPGVAKCALPYLGDVAREEVAKLAQGVR
jgi:hypothetical protein